jgi:pimeloyl-ACP methyl ester carboxylesterase
MWVRSTRAVGATIGAELSGGGHEMRVDSDGVCIEYDVTGAADGAPVMLVHGFPDTGRVWHNQVDALADAGLRVIVPDMRGCGRSDRPDAVEAYHLLCLAGDVVAVLDDLGIGRAAIVGHDWGAAVAWTLASLAAERVERMVALSVGHPTAFRLAGLAQQEKSWYMLLFHVPGVAERWLSDNGWANMRDWSGHPDADAVVVDLEDHRSLTAALNWYRANLPPETWVDPPSALPPVQCPVMGMWSSGDFALLEPQMTASAQFCTGGFTYQRVDDAGHWMQLDAPETVNHLLIDFLT